MPDASAQPPIDLSHPSLHHDPSTGIKHSYFTYGVGPTVILMHEITGMTDLFTNTTCGEQGDTKQNPSTRRGLILLH